MQQPAGLVSRLLRYHGPTTTATAALPIFRCWPILGHCMQNSAILVQNCSSCSPACSLGNWGGDQTSPGVWKWFRSHVWCQRHIIKIKISFFFSSFFTYLLHHYTQQVGRAQWRWWKGRSNLSLWDQCWGKVNQPILIVFVSSPGGLQLWSDCLDNITPKATCWEWEDSSLARCSCSSSQLAVI